MSTIRGVVEAGIVQYLRQERGLDATRAWLSDSELNYSNCSCCTRPSIHTSIGYKRTDGITMYIEVAMDPASFINDVIGYFDAV